MRDTISVAPAVYNSFVWTHVRHVICIYNLKLWCVPYAVLKTPLCSRVETVSLIGSVRSVHANSNYNISIDCAIFCVMLGCFIFTAQVQILYPPPPAKPGHATFSLVTAPPHTLTMEMRLLFIIIIITCLSMFYVCVCVRTYGLERISCSSTICICSFVFWSVNLMTLYDFS